jgi:hypothetical protein
MTERVGKRLVCELGTISQNGEAEYGCAATGSDYEYRAFFRNDGSSGCRYQIEGGGVNWAMARVLAIVDEAGRVMGAQFGVARGDEATPSAELMPLPGQRVVQMDVPDEVEQLSGVHLTRFFSQVEVSWPATVNVPRIEVVRRHDSDEA